jgi:hypothetical protein
MAVGIPAKTISTKNKEDWFSGPFDTEEPTCHTSDRVDENKTASSKKPINADKLARWRVSEGRQS